MGNNGKLLFSLAAASAVAVYMVCKTVFSSDSDAPASRPAPRSASASAVKKPSALSAPPAKAKAKPVAPSTQRASSPAAATAKATTPAPISAPIPALKPASKPPAFGYASPFAASIALPAMARAAVVGGSVVKKTVLDVIPSPDVVVAAAPAATAAAVANQDAEKLGHLADLLVFLNTAAPRAIAPQVEPVSSVASEDVVVANITVPTATETDRSASAGPPTAPARAPTTEVATTTTTTTAPVPAPTPAIQVAKAKATATTTATAPAPATQVAPASATATTPPAQAAPKSTVDKTVGIMSRRATSSPRWRAHSLVHEYARKVGMWPLLYKEKRIEWQAVLITLALLDDANDGLPFAALRHPLDVVDVVIRCILRDDILLGRAEVLHNWYPEYKAFESRTAGSAAKLTDADRILQERLSDWGSAPA